MHEKGFARERLHAVPARYLEMARRHPERRNPKSRLVQRPSLFEIARCKPQQGRLELGRGVAGLEGEGQIEMELRLVVTTQCLLHDTDIDVRIGRAAVHR